MKKHLALLTVAALAGLVMATSGYCAAPKKAVFWDSAIKPNWLEKGEDLSKYLEDEGYDLLDASTLGEFMTKRITDKLPSVIVFAVDRAPVSVVPKANKNNVLRQYLDAGGKIVWIGDIPLYAVQDPASDTPVILGESAQTAVLGSSMITKFDANEDVTITEAGEKWGLTEIWASSRTVKPAKSQLPMFTPLAVIGDGSYFAAWVKNYGGPEGTGFVRVFDKSGSPSDWTWIKAVAEYGLK